MEKLNIAFFKTIYTNIHVLFSHFSSFFLSLLFSLRAQVNIDVLSRFWIVKKAGISFLHLSEHIEFSFKILPTGMFFFVKILLDHYKLSFFLREVINCNLCKISKTLFFFKKFFLFKFALSDDIAMMTHFENEIYNTIFCFDFRKLRFVSTKSFSVLFSVCMRSLLFSSCQLATFCFFDDKWFCFQSFGCTSSFILYQLLLQVRPIDPFFFVCFK